MNSEFRYFHWAIPSQDKELYGLYDVFDNQLLLLTYDFDIAWQLKNFIRSKIILAIVDFSNQLDSDSLDLDNSVIENWGLEIVPKNVIQDPPSQTVRYSSQDLYRETYMIKNTLVCKNNFALDEFKTDLQKQIFFLHYCLWQAKHERRYHKKSIFYQHLLTAIELGINYFDVLDKFLNFKECINDELCDVMLNFLVAERLTFE